MDIAFIGQIINHKDYYNWHKFDFSYGGRCVIGTAFEGLQILNHGINFIHTKEQITYASHVTSWQDRISAKRLFIAEFFGDFLEAMNSVIALVFNEIIPQFIAQCHMERAGSPEIFDSVLDREMQSAIIPSDIANSRVDVYSRTAFCLHFLQLTSNRSGLISHNVGLILQDGESAPGFFVGATDGAPLQNGYAKSEKSSYGKSYRRDDQPFRYSYKWGLGGI